MDKITVQIGSLTHFNNGTVDRRRPVQFEGEQLARRSIPHDNRGNRGRVETLYRTADGRFIAHVRRWSQWQGESDDYTIREVSETDLDVNGKFEHLGREAGLTRPLTLDEGIPTLE